MSGASRGGDATKPQQPPAQEGVRLPPAWLDVAAGVFAGASNVVAGHPFDTVKVVLQASSPGQHTGALDATRHILRQGGVRASAYRAVTIGRDARRATRANTPRLSSPRSRASLAG
jgi:hypothetical protein